MTESSLVLDRSPPIGKFRPSCTYLFESAATAFGPSAVAVILSGMGRDGVAGLRSVKRVGGLVLAQDEASSVVYGMPGTALAEGVVHRVEAIDRMARSNVRFGASRSCSH